MHVVVTGAAGFVGQALVQRLLTPGNGLLGTSDRLTLVDRCETVFGPCESRVGDERPRVEQVIGNFGDVATLDRAFDEPVDLLFHLASVPGSLAEREPELGREVNLLAPLRLFDRLSKTAGSERKAPPRVVFASSIAVYGALAPRGEDEGAMPRPGLSYGAHKWMTEIDLADRTRRLELDARSVRLPGVVARPPAETGHGSAFMSQVFHRLAAGQPFQSPVSPTATSWWMSRGCCVDNLLHAAGMPVDTQLTGDRVWQLPVLCASMQEIVSAIASELGVPGDVLVDWRADARIERLFGALPSMATPRAEAVGFRADDGVAGLVRRLLRDGEVIAHSAR